MQLAVDRHLNMARVIRPEAIIACDHTLAAAAATTIAAAAARFFAAAASRLTSIISMARPWRRQAM